MRLHEAGKVTQPQGPVRRRLGRDLRRRQRRALRVARRQRGGRLPAGRRRQLARLDPRQPEDGDDQRRDRRRRPRPGRRRHDRRPPALGHRRPRGLRHRPGARASTTTRCSACRRRSRSTASCARGSCPASRPATVITTPRHQVDIIVTEYGAAELGGKTIHQRGTELARIAHPDFRDEMLEAAERASGGNAPFGCRRRRAPSPPRPPGRAAAGPDPRGRHQPHDLEPQPAGARRDARGDDARPARLRRSRAAERGWELGAVADLIAGTLASEVGRPLRADRLLARRRRGADDRRSPARPGPSPDPLPPPPASGRRRARCR